MPKVITIDAGWVKILKENVPLAFSQKCQFEPSVFFIDGQIKLMKAESINTWALFIRQQFIRCLDRAFEQGIPVVVLGFDNYVYVPTAKSMTQRKRMRDVAALEFQRGQELPTTIPDNWSAAIKNRAFKTKVISFVVSNLRSHYQNISSTLIIDYMGVPEVIGAPIQLPTELQNVELKRGECDIKAFFWNRLGPLLIDSTDGDFIPISLLQYDKCMSPIALHRFNTRVRSSKPSDPRYEYVNIETLHAYVVKEMRRSSEPCRDFASLVGMVGCDFTMSLPQIGPKTLWSLRPFIKNNLLDSPAGRLMLVVRTMLKTHQKHLSCIAKKLNGILLESPTQEEAENAYTLLYTTLRHKNSVSERIRNKLWTPARMCAHVKNVTWTLQYWELLHHFADPLDSDFGYKRSKNVITYEG